MKQVLLKKIVIVVGKSTRSRVLWGIGMAMGRGGTEGWDLRSHPAWFCFAPSPLRPARQGKLSHPIPTPWGPVKSYPIP